VRIVAVTNIKGGVGKATVLWDLDPQGAATYTLRCEAQEHASVKKLLSGKRELPELIVSSGYDKLDVLPADFS
jgi:chromosome partitioning protein